MKLRAIGIIVAAALSLFGVAHAADKDVSSQLRYEIPLPGDWKSWFDGHSEGSSYTGVVWNSPGDYEEDLCRKTKDEELAFRLSREGKVIASIAMDGTVHGDSDDIRGLSIVIYGMMQDRYASQYCGHMSKAIPAVKDLK